MKMFRNNTLMADLAAAYWDEARLALLEKPNRNKVTAERVDRLLQQTIRALEEEYGGASVKPRTNGHVEPQEQQQQ